MFFCLLELIVNYRERERERERERKRERERGGGSREGERNLLMHVFGVMIYLKRFTFVFLIVVEMKDTLDKVLEED